jgi:hypothetical protein
VTESVVIAAVIVARAAEIEHKGSCQRSEQSC